LELIGVLIAILLLPKDPKNAWVFGYSSIRIVMLGAGSIVAAAFTAIAYKAWRDPEKFIHPLQNRNIFLSIFWASLALVLLSFSVYLNLVEFPNSTIQGYINRLAPFSIIGLCLGFQTLILVVLLNQTAFIEHYQEIKTPLAIILVLMVSLSRIVPLFHEYVLTDLDPDVHAYRIIANDMLHPYDTEIREPVWIWAVELSTTLFGGGDIVFRYLGLFLFIITGYFLYRLTLDTFKDRFLAIVTLAIYYFNTFLIRIALRGLRDNLFVFAVVGMSYFVFSKNARISEKSRIIGLTIFFLLAGGTKISSLLPLGLVLVYAFLRNKLRLTYLLPIGILILVVISPYLVYSQLEFSDPMYSTNIHATWWRNYEFVILKGTGCNGCPTLEEFSINPYSGETVTSFEYIFGMHSIQDLLNSMFEGFRTLYFSSSPLFDSLLGVDELGVIWFCLYLIGAILLITGEERMILVLPLLVTSLLIFMVQIVPQRYFINNAPFLILIAATGFVQVTRWIEALVKK